MPIAIRPLSGDYKPLWGIQAHPFSRALVAIAKETPGMRWDADVKSWVGHIDAIDTVCWRLVEERGLRIDTSRLPDLHDLRHHLIFAINGAGGRSLRGYQKHGVDFLICNAQAGCILADDMGLGKSAIALMAVRAFGGKTLIVCPSSARPVWADPERGEIAKWWPKMLPRIFKAEGIQEFELVPGPTLKAKCLDCGMAASCSGCLAGEGCDFTPKCGTIPSCAGAWAPCEGTLFVESLFGRLAAFDKGSHRWSREHPVRGASKPLKVPDDSQIVIIHADILYAWIEALAAWGFINLVIDEGHLYMTEKARRSLAMRSVIELALPDRRIALTGTPLTNRVRDIWNLIDILSPGRMGKNFFNFSRRYCNGHYEEISKDIGNKWISDGKSNIPELQRRLGWFTLRRTTEEVKLELPDKTRQVIRVEVPVQYQQTSVAQIDKRLVQAMLEKSVDGKMKDIVTLLRDHLEAGRGVAVATFRRSVAEYLVNQLQPLGLPCRFIHGGVSKEKRNAIIEELRILSEQGPVLLAATLDTAAVAIDLTFVPVSVVAELTYEPHKLLQWEKRTHRFGQKRNVLVQYPIGIGTIEEYIAEVVIDRLDTFEHLLGKTDGLGEALAGAEEDVLKLLGDRLRAAAEADLKAGRLR